MLMINSRSIFYDSIKNNNGILWTDLEDCPLGNGHTHFTITSHALKTCSSRTTSTAQQRWGTGLLLPTPASNHTQSHREVALTPSHSLSWHDYHCGVLRLTPISLTLSLPVWRAEMLRLHPRYRIQDKLLRGDGDVTLLLVRTLNIN